MAHEAARTDGSGGGSKAPPALRTLNLTLNLANTDRGLSRRQLGQLVEEYRDLTPDTFQRTFERDLRSLRDAGLVIDLIDGNPPRYRLSGASFPAPQVIFSQMESDLLGQAAAAWRGLGQTDAAQLRTKLAAYAPASTQLANAPVDRNLEGVEHLPRIVAAIERRQPLRFVYASRSGIEERDVAPWTLIFRGTAVYLTGFDLNRWEPRRFRLSRIQSALEWVGEPDAYEIPEDAQADFESGFFRIRPLLWVEQGFGTLVRIRSGQPLAPRDYPASMGPVAGWDLLWGEEDDQSVWEQLIVDDCLHVVPADDSALRQRVLAHLRVASAWESGAAE